MGSRMKWVCLVAALGAFTALAGGCGSLGSLDGTGGLAVPPSQTGRVSLTIQWPTRQVGPIAVPAGTESVKIEVSGSWTPPPSNPIVRMVNNPGNANSTPVDIDGVPAGPIVVTVTAYSGANGTGTVLGVGTITATVTAGGTTLVSLTVSNAVSSVVVSPSSASVAVGDSVQLTATAKNAAGEALMVSPNIITWATDNATAASVTGGGAGQLRVSVKGNAPGTAHITVTCAGTSGSKSAASTITVAEHGQGHGQGGGGS